MRLQLLSGPTQEPVTLAEAKAHCRIDGTEDDGLLSAQIAAARQWCEEYTGRALVAQHWRLWLDAAATASLEAGAIALPRPPLLSVTQIVQYDANDLAGTIAAADYFVDSAAIPGRVLPRDGGWPLPGREPNGMMVEFQAGYGTAGTAVPAALRQGILQHIAQLYEQRGDVVPGAISVPAASQTLYGPFRVTRL